MKPPHIEPPSVEAQPLFRVIVEAIQRGQIQEGKPETFLPYSRALELMGVSAKGRAGQQLQRTGLSALNDWTIEHQELPKIGALIVNKQTHLPGVGFARSHGYSLTNNEGKEWWMREANRAINYNWQTFLKPMVRYPRASSEEMPSVLREEASYQEFIVANPPPAHIRQSKVTVGEILRGFAAGKSEEDILGEHKGLRREDIRASLAYAAEQEAQSPRVSRKVLRHPTFTEKWGGKFTLPKPDPTDLRLNHILEKYERMRE